MEISAKKCSFCITKNSKYSCPKCGRPFCSSECYRHSDHLSCSESFYKGCIEEELKLGKTEDEKSQSKRRMFEILKRIKTKDELDSDDDDFEENVDNLSDSTMDAIETKFSTIDFSNPDVGIKELWSKLNQQEVQLLKMVLDKEDISEIITIWEPWWCQKERLVTEVTDQAEETSIPLIKTTIIPLKSLTSITPSSCTINNLVNILGSYAYLTRYFNGEHQQEKTDAAELGLNLTYVLSRERNFNSAAEALHYVKDGIIQNNELSIQSFVLILKDVQNLLVKTDFILSALSDFQSLLVGSKVKKSQYFIQNKKLVNGAIKKMDYFMSWTISTDKMIFDKIKTDIALEVATLLSEETAFKHTVTKEGSDFQKVEYVREVD